VRSRIIPWWSGLRVSPKGLALVVSPLCVLLWWPFGSEAAADCVSRCRAVRAMAGAVRRGSSALLIGGLNGSRVLFWSLPRSSMAWRGLLRWMRSLSPPPWFDGARVCRRPLACLSGERSLILLVLVLDSSAPPASRSSAPHSARPFEDEFEDDHGGQSPLLLGLTECVCVADHSPGFWGRWGSGTGE
jgi:hypothetical protein